MNVTQLIAALSRVTDPAGTLVVRGERQGQSLGGRGVLDRGDVFKTDPAAPQWVRGWDGPFTIRVRAT